MCLYSFSRELIKVDLPQMNEFDEYQLTDDLVCLLYRVSFCNFVVIR